MRVRSPSLQLLRRLSPCVAVVAALAASGCSSGTDTPGGQTPAKTIEVTITKPTELSYHTGKITFSGSLKPSEAGVGGLNAEFKMKSTVLTTSQGGTFNVEVDTAAKDAKGKPLFKDGKNCIGITARGEGVVPSKVNHCVIVDNSDPVITVNTPQDGGVYIGEVQVTGAVADKYIADIVVKVDGKIVAGYCDPKKDEDGDDKPDCSVEECVKKYGQCLTTKGFSIKVDKAPEPDKSGKIPTVSIVVEATDVTGHSATVERKVRILKAPRFETVSRFPNKVGEEDPVGAMADVLIYDFDRDGVLDALVGGVKGLFLRRGENVGTKDKPKGSGKFGPPQQISDAAMIGMTLADIDGDKAKIKDVYAVGIGSEGKPLAMALLVKEGGLRVVQTVALKGTPLSITSGDMDLNGVPDVVVGSKQSDVALQIVPALAPDSLLCPGKDDDKRLCKSVTKLADLGGGQIFGTPYQRQLAGGITTVLVDDFFIASSGEAYPDIVAARSETASLSVCPNNKGNIEACIDVQKTSYVADMTDVAFIVKSDWNQDGKMDLIIGSKGAGIQRWIASRGDGTFEFDPLTYRTWRFSGMTTMTLGPVGPGGKDYIMLSGGGRTVTFVPVDPGDNSVRDKCFRSWILGDSVRAVRRGDVDNDGDTDLIAIDPAVGGLTVAKGTGDGNYEAPTVHRSCGLVKGGFFFTILPVAHFKFADVSADGKPDLLMMTNAATSLITYKKNGCLTASLPPKPVPRPTHYMHLYVNEGDRLEEKARAGEWGPYNSITDRAAAGVKQEAKATCSGNFPDITGFELGEFNQTPPIDLAITRAADYTAGEPPGQGAKCPFKEYNEVANLFGTEVDDGEEGSGLKCVNFKNGVEKKDTPLSSKSGGAPLIRGSLLTFINADPAKPFGLGTDNRPDNPADVRHFFMAAGGKAPIGLVVGKFDNDNTDDIATLMRQVGGPTEEVYLAPRIRTFKVISGRPNPVLYFKNGTKGGEALGTVNTATPKQVVGLNELSVISKKNEDDIINQEIEVSYHTTGDLPFVVRGSGFCQEGQTSFFITTKIGKDVKLAVIRSQGNLKYSPAQTISAGTDKGAAFALVDADSDFCTDAVSVVDSHLAYAKGTSSWFESWRYFTPLDLGTVPSIELLDVNNDGTKDLLLVDGDKHMVRFYLNDGEGSFVAGAEPVLTLFGSTRSEIGDVDGDGCVDLAVQGERGVAIVRSLGCEKKAP